MNNGKYDFKLQFKITHEDKGLAEQELRGLEERLRVRLPDQYRQFLLQHNGLEFDISPCFPIAQSPPEYGSTESLVLLLGVRTGVRVRNIEDKMEAYDFCYRVPRGFVCIGLLSGGVMLCISPTGEVYIWSPEDDWDEDESESTEHLYLVAKTFREFWESLTLEASDRSGGIG